MIEAEALTMHYGSVIALQDASFRAEPGEVLGLLGPNGAGKSTVMKILTTYLYPTAGTARVGGKDVKKEPMEVRRLIGYLPEVLPLYPDMEVGEYLAFVGRGRRLSGKDLRDRMSWVVERTGLEPMFRRPIRELSKGYLQRTALAQALIHDPEIVILDEPTSGLDPHQILEVRRLIRELSAKKTVIFSTHILREVEAIAHRVVIINQGRIVADGTIEQLCKDVQRGACICLKIRGAPEGIEREVMSFPHVTGVEMEREGQWALLTIRCQDVDPLMEVLMELITKRGWKVAELSQKGVSLEEAFLALTEDQREEGVKGGS